MKIQKLYELTNDENRFLLFETASNRYLIAFSQTPFFEIKIKKAPPMVLGFLALISGEVELEKVADPNSLVYKRLEKSENF